MFKTHRAVGGLLAIARWEEEEIRGCYSKAWHRKYGPKRVISNRGIEVYDASGACLGVQELDRWPAGGELMAITMGFAQVDPTLLPLIIATEPELAKHATTLLRRKGKPCPNFSTTPIGQPSSQPTPSTPCPQPETTST